MISFSDRICPGLRQQDDNIRYWPGKFKLQKPFAERKRLLDHRQQVAEVLRPVDTEYVREPLGMPGCLT